MGVTRGCRVGAAALALAAGCATSPATEPLATGRIVTVGGSVDPGEWGRTLMHEHIVHDLALGYAPSASADREARRLWAMTVRADTRATVLAHYLEVRDNLVFDDLSTAQTELGFAKEAGVEAIVDVTPPGLGRDPDALRRLSAETGLRIVMGSGFYRRPWMPADVERRSIDSMADEIVSDIVDGVGPSRIRAGIIGEVGAMDVRPPFDNAESKSVAAAARAACRTGAAISIHQFYRAGEELGNTLALLRENGAAMDRVIVGHVERRFIDAPGALDAALAQGVTLEFDLLNGFFKIDAPSTDQRPMLDAIVRLVQAGHARQILLSHDTVMKIQLRHYGGQGYAYIPLEVVPYLRARGVSEADLHGMLVENPRRLLTLAPPRCALRVEAGG